MDTEAKEILASIKSILDSDDFEEAISRHPKVDFDGLVDALSNKGVTFNEMGVSEAKQVLTDLNYYYKLTVYRRNFRKNAEGKYVNLDFKTLADTASVDMQLRYLLLSAVLDIEHALKTFLVAQVTNNEELNGYDIVDRFFHSTIGTTYETSKEKTLEKIKHKSSYQRKLYEAHKDAPPVWVLVEIMNFGEFLRLFEFYFNKYPSHLFEINKMIGVLNAVKQIRNCCAHSNAFLFYLSSNPINHINKYIKNYALDAKIGELYYHCAKVHDVIAVIFAHDFFVKGSGSRKYRQFDIASLANRSLDRFSHLERDNDIVHFFNVVKKMINNYGKFNVDSIV